MPYFKRHQQLKNTLLSFLHHYKIRRDYEVILIEDIKNINDIEEHKKLKRVISEFRSEIPIIYLKADLNYLSNQVIAFNIGARNAKGEYLVVTNPECSHQSNILAGFDTLLNEKKDVYIVCACKFLLKDKKNRQELEKHFPRLLWYQHSRYRNKLYHFCSCLSKDQFISIGGFDEHYKNGVGYDDDDFREKVRFASILIIAADDLIVLHQEHEKSYKGSFKNETNEMATNRKYYERKWKEIMLNN